MPIMDMFYGEWLPSQPTFKNPGCEEADNVIPSPGGYDPFLAFQGTGQSSTENVRGAAQLYDNDGASVIVAGSATRLMVRRGSITETAGLTQIGTDEAWSFARFNDFVFATAQGNAVQYLSNIGTDNTWSAAPGSPPAAKRCAKVGDFLMLGNLPSNPSAIQWSPYNNPTGTWGTDRRTQAGLAFLPAEMGEVQHITGGRYPLVFQERGLCRLSYVGPPVVWHKDVVTSERGALAPHAVVSVGYLTYFLAQDGFFVTNGSQVEPIGTQRVNRWFFKTVDQASLYLTQGAVDWQNECIVWSFSSEGSVFDRKLIYSWAQNRWTSATITTDWIVSSETERQTLEDIGAAYPTLEDVPLSLDARFWSATDRTLGVFAGREYGLFAGLPLKATWRTGSMQPSPGQRAFVSEVAPMIDSGTWDMTFKLYLTDNRGQVTESNTAEVGWSGFAPVRGEGQQIAVEMIKPAGSLWSGAQGAQVLWEGAGYR